MAKHAKVLSDLWEDPVRSNIKWSDLRGLLIHLGYQQKEGSGSRVKFIHMETQRVISLHKPHPGNTIKAYVVRELRAYLPKSLPQ